MTSRPIAKVAIDSAKLDADLHRLNAFPKIEEQYDEFSSGFWKNCSLWNRTGEAKDTLYCDFETPIQQTEYGRGLPYIDKLLRTTFDFRHLKMVRTRNLIDAIVIPHRDFVELDADKRKYFRVFLPLENNADAFHSDEEKVFQMQKGEVWWLDAASVHSAANFSANSRVHLCLDFRFDSNDFDDCDIFLDAKEVDTEVKPTLVDRKSEDEFAQANVKALAPILSDATFRDIAFLLSKVHFERDVPVDACFDWLIAMAAAKPDGALEAKARDLRRYLIEKRDLGERFSFHCAAGKH